MRISKIIAWLLNPLQTHGQGGIFLNLFVEELGLETSIDECGRANVRTEVPITRGRLDILIGMKNLTIAIENKPWAGDQNEQLKTYFAHFDKLGRGRYLVLYLTREGTEPSEQSLCKSAQHDRIGTGQLRLCAYSGEIQRWLEKCRLRCRADRVSTFLDEFCRYIRTTLEGIKDKTMSDHLVDEIAGSAEKVSAAMQVAFLIDSLRKKLLLHLRQQLVDNLPGRTIELHDDPWQKFSGVTISFSEASPYSFGLELQNSQFNRLVVGLYRKVSKSPERGNEYDLVVGSLGAASKNDYWLWQREASTTDSLLPVERDWGISAEPWIEIADGTLSTKIAEAFTRAESVLSECGVG